MEDKQNTQKPQKRDLDKIEKFLKTVESKLKKEEKHTWMVKDLDHLNRN